MKKPQYKIGDIVFVNDKELQEGRIFQGVIESAELIGDTCECWFYGIKVPQASVDSKDEKLFSYGGNCGDARSKIISVNEIENDPDVPFLPPPDPKSGK